jgi:hypothetical protein
MASHRVLSFVLARSPDVLPDDRDGWSELAAVQAGALDSGFALRILRPPSGWQGSLEALVEEGRASARGEDPFSGPDAPEPAGGGGRLLCDAVIPHFRPSDLHLGVYELLGSLSSPDPGSFRAADVAAVRRLDHLPLSVVENETCWFYPTETGAYLSWENQRRLRSLPGFLPDACVSDGPIDYARTHLRLLWSLLADDEVLTCVGLTYQNRRIDWPLRDVIPSPSAAWSSFRVDAMAEPAFQTLATITTTGPIPA